MESPLGQAELTEGSVLRRRPDVPTYVRIVVRVCRQERTPAGRRLCCVTHTRAKLQAVALFNLVGIPLC